MGWWCFGRRKWSQRVWSPDGAAQVSEVSPAFSTTSLIPLAHPQQTLLQQILGANTIGRPAEDHRSAAPVLGSAATFPSPSPASPHQARDQPHSDAQDHGHIPGIRRRMSTDLPARSVSTPAERAVISRRRPRPQSVPASREVVPTADNMYHGRRGSSSRLLSSTNLSAAVGGRVESAARSVNNLHELSAQNCSVYDRVSSRLNEVIDQIDHEIFSGGEYIYGSFVRFVVGSTAN
jgi:hypothetical protein